MITIQQIIGTIGECSEVSLDDTVVMASETTPVVAMLHNPREKHPYCIVHVIGDHMLRSLLDRRHTFTESNAAVSYFMSQVSAVERI